MRDKHSTIDGLICIDTVNNMLIEGISNLTIASFIQDQGEKIDVSKKAIAVALGRYKKDLIKELGVFSEKGFASETILRIQEGLDEIVELGALYEVQVRRIQVGLDAEKRDGELNKGIRDEMKFAREILQTRRVLREKPIYTPDKTPNEEDGTMTFSGGLKSLNDGRSKSRILSAVVALISQESYVETKSDSHDDNERVKRLVDVEVED